MKRMLLIIFFCYLIFSCQKTIHWDIASTGFLLKDNNGNCLPIAINGNYIEDSTITNNTFIVVDVNVTSLGTYNIFTDSINGYVFKASGNFNNSGINHVKLLCSGKPIRADTNYFIIHYDTSVCEATVVVKSNAIPNAVFSLQGAPGKCLNDTVIGAYIKGMTLDTSDKANVNVNVTSAGRYNISTTIVNGYSFTASGSFTRTGIQTVTLFPKGTPLKEGTDIFNVLADSSACHLEVKVTSHDAKFILQGALGKCLNDTVIGAYTKNFPLDTVNNKVKINADVNLPGMYTIITNTANGYSFAASGVFTTAGLQTVTLYPKGTPLKEGTDIFEVTGDSSTCNIEVKVNSDEAMFTFEGAPGKCLDDSIIGTYVKRIPLDTFSKINIKVNVALPGKYYLTTNVVNGYSFHVGGVFTETGIQTVTLYADGMPLEGGTNVFTLSGGISTCSFEVKVLSEFVTVTGDDYFPLTDSSYWIYDDLFYRGNSIKRSIDGDSTANNKVYQVMNETDNYGSHNQYLFRRKDADYYEYARRDRYTSAIQYAKIDFADLLFLNQYVQQGNSWESPEFQDVATFNQVIVLKYEYTCLKTNGVVTINGKAFANVCIIQMEPLIRSLGNDWSYTNEVYTYYCAKGVGLIYYHAVNNMGYRKAEMQLKSWLVK